NCVLQIFVPGIAANASARDAAVSSLFPPATTEPPQSLPGASLLQSEESGPHGRLREAPLENRPASRRAPEKATARAHPAPGLRAPRRVYLPKAMARPGFPAGPVSEDRSPGCARARTASLRNCESDRSCECAPSPAARSAERDLQPWPVAAPGGASSGINGAG